MVCRLNIERMMCTHNVKEIIIVSLVVSFLCHRTIKRYVGFHFNNIFFDKTQSKNDRKKLFKSIKYLQNYVFR